MVIGKRMVDVSIFDECTNCNITGVQSGYIYTINGVGTCVLQHIHHRSAVVRVILKSEIRQSLGLYNESKNYSN